MTSRPSGARKVAEGSHQNTIGQEDVSTGVSGAEGGWGLALEGYDNHPKAHTCCPRSVMSLQLPAQAQRPGLIPREDSTPDKSRPSNSLSLEEALG